MQKEQEFVFIWYNELQIIEGKKYISPPFRTKIKARDIEEARVKMELFVEKRMKKVIQTEAEFDKSKLRKIQSVFSEFEIILEQLNAQISTLFKKFHI